MPPLELDTLTLAAGSHAETQDAMCVMEAAAYVAGEPWSDHPQCVSPVIAAFLRRWNDDLNDADRQMLRPYIPRVIGTNTGEKDDETRAWLVTDWMVREYLPAWLDAARLKDQADAVRSLPPVTAADAWKAARETVGGAGKKSAAARDAAQDAAWAAARAAAQDAAWDAARDAAQAAAWDAAWDAARAAARDAARAAARDAARAAAQAAARDAAWAAAWDAAWDAARAAAQAAARDAAWAAAWAAARDAAWDAAWAAARKTLRPTVEGIQQSALKLIDQMIAVGK